MKAAPFITASLVPVDVVHIHPNVPIKPGADPAVAHIKLVGGSTSACWMHVTNSCTSVGDHMLHS